MLVPQQKTWRDEESHIGEEDGIAMATDVSGGLSSGLALSVARPPQSVPSAALPSHRHERIQSRYSSSDASADACVEGMRQVQT